MLGGYFVPLAPWLLPAAEEQLREGTAAPDAGGCRVTASTLGHGAAATGGAASSWTRWTPARCRCPTAPATDGLAVSHGKL